MTKHGHRSGRTLEKRAHEQSRVPPSSIRSFPVSLQNQRSIAPDCRAVFCHSVGVPSRSARGPSTLPLALRDLARAAQRTRECSAIAQHCDTRLLPIDFHGQGEVVCGPSPLEGEVRWGVCGLSRSTLECYVAQSAYPSPNPSLKGRGKGSQMTLPCVYGLDRRPFSRDATAGSLTGARPVRWQGRRRPGARAPAP